MRKYHADIVGMVLAGSLVVTLFAPTFLGIMVCVLEYWVWFRLRRVDWQTKGGDQ